jgi:hypothetical protein
MKSLCCFLWNMRTKGPGNWQDLRSCIRIMTLDMSCSWTARDALTYLTSIPGGCEWPASRPKHFACRATVCSTYRLEGWVGFRAGLDAVATREITAPHPASKCGQPTRNLVTELTELHLEICRACRHTQNGIWIHLQDTVILLVSEE